MHVSYVITLTDDDDVRCLLDLRCMSLDTDVATVCCCLENGTKAEEQGRLDENKLLVRKVLGLLTFFVIVNRLGFGCFKFGTQDAAL